MKPVPVGAKGKFEQAVETRHLASELDSSLAAVLSTPTMVAMMEQAAIERDQAVPRRRRKLGRHDDRSQSHRSDAARVIAHAPRPKSPRSRGAALSFLCARSMTSSRLAPEAIDAP